MPNNPNSDSANKRIVPINEIPVVALNSQASEDARLAQALDAYIRGNISAEDYRKAADRHGEAVAWNMKNK